MPLTAFRNCSGLGRMLKRSFATARLHAGAMLTSTESTALKLAVGSGLTTRSEQGEIVPLAMSGGLPSRNRAAIAQVSGIVQELQLDVANRFELKGRMDRLFILRNHRNSYFVGHALIRVWALLFCSSLGALAQSTAPPVNASAPFSIRATHLLGLKNTKSNCNGTLSIQGDALQFQQGGKPGAEVKITSIQAVFLGGESKQVGGLPMTLSKAATPFGGGRVVSLFAHKKYDTLTLEYVDSDGGVHGAIFQLSKGQAELVRDELVDLGVSPSSGKDQPTKQSTVEVMNENK